MLLLTWWALCFGSSYVFAWLAPALLFLPLLPIGRLRIGPARPAPRQTTPAQPATSETLLHTLSDLNKIQGLLPASPGPSISHWYARFTQLGPWRLVRGLVVIWSTWLVLGYTLGTRVLAALTGSAILLAPSPPLAHVISLLGKSLAARRVAALLFLIVFGSPERDYKLGSPIGWVKSKWARSRRPSAALAFKPVDKEDEDPAPADRAGNPIYFRFEIHENQRWWMGLDWTSALLPQERPSWCDSHLFPVSPPQAFVLPPPSSIDFPSPTKSEPRAMVRRTATWRWLDDDWNIVRAGPGAGVTTAAVIASPVEEPAPSSRPSSGVFSQSMDDNHARAPSIAEQAFAKGLGRLKGVPLPGTSSPGQSPVRQTDPRRARTGSEASSDISHHIDDIATSPFGSPIAESDEATDGDGWVYGDNKWENMTAKGGLGKFTRRRRWHRRAVCVETVHRIAELAVPEGYEAGSGAATPTAERQRSGSVPIPLKAAPLAATTEDHHSQVLDALRPKQPSVAPAPAPSSVIPSTSSARDDALRQRLKKAMGNMGA